MKKYIKGNVTVEAIRIPDFGEDAADELIDLVHENDWVPEGEYLIIKTTDGDAVASPGDWIVKTERSDYYVCKSDVFHVEYKEVEHGSRD